MIKVIVVFYGLVMFVPHGVVNEATTPQATGMTVLFADAGPLKPMDLTMKHEPMAWLVDKSSEPLPDSRPVAQLYEVPDQARRPLTFAINHQAEGKIELEARWYFPKMDILKPGVKVTDSCLKPTRQCRIGDDDLVVARAQISGPWTTRPATICDDELILEFRDRAAFSFRRERGQARRHHDEDPPFSLATALVLEGLVRDDDLANVMVIPVDDGSGESRTVPVPLIKLDNAFCKHMNWVEQDESYDCAVTVLSNSPQDDLPCKRLDHDLVDCPFDTHFRVFHHLVNDPNPESGWLPYVERFPECEIDSRWAIEIPPKHSHVSSEAPSTQPSPRCPPAFGVP